MFERLGRAFAALREPSDRREVLGLSSSATRVFSSAPQGDGELSYPPLLRVLDFIPAVVGGIITETIHVVDNNGDRVESEEILRMQGWLRNSWDGGVTPALHDASDVVVELFRDGNSYSVPVGPERNRYRRLYRYRANGSSFDSVNNRYQVNERDQSRRPVFVNAPAIIHSRWGPVVGGSDLVTSVSPVQQLRDSMNLGQDAMKWASDEVNRPPGAGLILGLENPLPPAPQPKGNEKGAKDIEIAKLKNHVENLGLLGMEGRGNITIHERRRRYQDYGISDIRNFQLDQVCAVFGCQPAQLGFGDTPPTAADERAFWVRVLEPTIRKILDPMSLRMLTRGLHFEVDPTYLYRSDLNALAGFIDKLLPNTGRIGIVPPSAIRRIARISLTAAEREELVEINRRSEQESATLNTEAQEDDSE